MERRTTRFLKIVSLFVFAIFLIGGFAPSRVFATKDLLKAAQEMYSKTEVKNCKYCHVKALPTKDDHESNDRGKWLIEQKKKRKADKIDVSWLKDYKEGK